MIDKLINLAFVDSFAFAINSTLGLLLQSKICNYSWDGTQVDSHHQENITDRQIP
jgi:hypothetical protein